MKRVNVNKEKKEITLTVNESFYDPDLVNQAIEDFKEVCDITKNQESIVLKPKEEGIELETLGYEFYNYLLGLIKNT